MDDLIGLVPILILQIPFVFFVYAISGRIKINRALWTVLACIPIFGLFVMYYVGFRFVIYVADSLNAINAKLDSK